MYERIFRDLQKKIAENVYHPGDKVPSEKELEQEYKVSRITAKKAMDMLAESHYIERFRGKGSFVSEKIREIMESADHTSKPESIIKKKRRRIGVVFDGFGSVFGAYLLRSIEQECTRRGYDMLFSCTYGSIETEAEAIQHSLDAKVDGLVIMCAQGEVYNSVILQLSLNHFPMVLVDRQIRGIQIPCVRTNNFEAARELTEILIEHGHKKICFLTHASIDTSSIRDRYSGFAACMAQDRGLQGVIAKVESYNPTPYDLDKECEKYNISEYKEVVESNRSCTAFLTTEYKIAVLLEHAMKQLGVQKEIATFDGLEPIYNEVYDFICVRQNETEMGRKTIETLEAIMRGENPDENLDIPYRIWNQGEHGLVFE